MLRLNLGCKLFASINTCERKGMEQEWAEEVKQL